jgi:hypothetical protein
VGNGVRFLVEIAVDRGESYHTALSTFDHAHPEDSEPLSASKRVGIV